MMRSLYSTSRRILSPSDAHRERFSPRNFGRYGLHPAGRKCKCCDFICACNPSNPKRVKVVIAGFTGCFECLNSTNIWRFNTEAFGCCFYVADSNDYGASGCTVNVAESNFLRAESFSGTSCGGLNPGTLCDSPPSYSGYLFYFDLSSTACFTCASGSQLILTKDSAPNNPVGSYSVYGWFVPGGAGCTCADYDSTGAVGTAEVTVLESCCDQCTHCSGCIEADICDDDVCCSPSIVRAVTSGITVDFGVCVVGSGLVNNFKLTGTTAANRTIDMTRGSGTSCTWEASVACDWVLTRYANAANCAASISPTASWTIETLRYQFRRTGATTWAYRVDGMDGAIARISVVGSNPGSCGFSDITSTATANDCNNITAPTHLSRISCVAEAGPTGIFGSGGSTTFTACP